MPTHAGANQLIFKTLQQKVEEALGEDAADGLLLSDMSVGKDGLEGECEFKPWAMPKQEFMQILL